MKKKEKTDENCFFFLPFFSGKQKSCECGSSLFQLPPYSLTATRLHSVCPLFRLFIRSALGLPFTALYFSNHPSSLKLSQVQSLGITRSVFLVLRTTGLWFQKELLQLLYQFN